MSDLYRISSVAQIHQFLGLPEPQHPLVTIYTDQGADYSNTNESLRFTSDLYTIFFKNGMEGSLGYGRNTYDFENSTLVFIGPNQVLSGMDPEYMSQCHGWTLMFHPDLIHGTPLGQRIKEYRFFDYELSEALHLSAQERTDIEEITAKITREYQQNMDRHSQSLIVSNLELLLNYCLRFYDRQFYTRTNFNKGLVSDFVHRLGGYFDSEKPSLSGIPSVKYFADELNMSPNYLSDLLKKETGKGAKSHINDYMVNKAKNLLLSTEKAISEIAYELGFEYPQGLNKLFKNKTGMTPAAYRVSNN